MPNIPNYFKTVGPVAFVGGGPYPKGDTAEKGQKEEKKKEEGQDPAPEKSKASGNTGGTEKKA